MKRLTFVLIASLALVVLGSGCDSLDELNVDPEELIKELRAANEGADKSLSQARELELREAGASDKAIDDLRRSRTLVTEALQTRDPGPVKDAIALRPYDVTPRFYEVAFMIAYDNEPEIRRGMGEISGLLYPPDRPYTDTTFTQFASARVFLDALWHTMAAFDASSPEWDRLNKAYCKILGDYQVQATALEQVQHLSLDPDRFSAGTCP